MEDTLFVVNRPIAAVQVRYTVRTVPEEWVLTEGTVPESVPHDDEAQHLKLVLTAWADRGRTARIARNLAIRWLRDDPRIGIDPDVCVLDPPPEDFDTTRSLRLWIPGHRPPRLCFEIVSKNHPHKDYAAIQDRYAAIGTEELVVFDPMLAGPRALGGPVPLQHWRRDGDLFERVLFGDGPVYSAVLDSWVIARDTRLVLADDRAGTRPWQTGEERERAEKERERAEKELERAEKELERAGRIELERRVLELEAKAEKAAR
jgi:hypothetical protein